MGEPEKWMQNPYLISTIPSLAPIHLKRRSESTNPHTLSRPSGSTKRPSTSGSTAQNVLNMGSAAAPAKVKYPYTVLTRGKKHHAYSKEVAPYPLNYENRLLDYDALDTMSSSTSPSLAHHVIMADRMAHPLKVLDVGCGNGAWCINAATQWPDTLIVGMDLVAIQPDPYALERIASRKGSKMPSKQPEPRPRTSTSDRSIKQAPLPSNSIYNRIKWVLHNFLTKRLPFKDDEFDLIHIRGIAQGIPEDDWTRLFTDLTRVLSPGGFLEIIEEDIIFPTIIAPTVTFGRSSKSHQKSLKSPLAQQALSKQILTYPEEARPSVYFSSPTGSRIYGADVSPSSPVNPFAMYDDSTGIMAPSSSSPSIHNIPASYLQYAQTVPDLARSLPPLALVNPFVHENRFTDQGETRPFEQDHTILERLYNAVFTKRWINLEPTSILGGVLGMQMNLSGIISSEPLEIARPYGQKATDQDDAATTSGRRRGSGGSRTLLNDVTTEDDAMDLKGGDSDSDDGAHGNGARPPSPPLTPTATSPVGGREDGSGTSNRQERKRANTSTTTQSGGVRKYPALALTAALHTIFPNLDSDIARTFHLQRAWENVVACKEAMWEEFLADSANRDMEAYTETQGSASPNPTVGSSSGSFISTMSTMSSMGGGMPTVTSLKSASSASGMPFGRGYGPGRGYRRAPTMLDELEWSESDQRRSERERFDILLDRYEMRIRRYCARILQTSTIPSFVPRDRHGWDADLEDSSDDELQLEYPEGPATIVSPSDSDAGRSNPMSPLVEEPPSASEIRMEDNEGNSSADEVTLAEPRTPHARSSISSLAPTHSQDMPSLPTIPSGTSLSVPMGSMMAKLKLNAAALQLNTSHNNPAASDRTRRRQQTRPSAIKQARDELEATPCRIIRAFIATKTLSAST